MFPWLEDIEKLLNKLEDVKLCWCPSINNQVAEYMASREANLLQMGEAKMWFEEPPDSIMTLLVADRAHGEFGR